MKKLLVVLFAFVMVGFISTSAAEASCFSDKGVITVAMKKAKKKKKVKKAKAVEKVILDNEFVTVTYLGISPQRYNGYEMKFKIKNKTDKKISVTEEDASVDDVMGYIGLIASIMPKKISLENCSFEELPKDNVEFKLRASDEEYNTLFETEVIRIDMKK